MDVLLTVSVVAFVAGFFALIFSYAIKPGAEHSSKFEAAAFQTASLNAPVFKEQVREKNYWKALGYVLVGISIFIRVITWMP